MGILSRFKPLALLSSLLIASTAVQAEEGRMYEVTVTNLTPGTVFTPIMVATHRWKYTMYSLGQPASPALVRMAEGGDTSGLPAMLHAYDSASTGDVLLPGHSVKVMVSADSANHFLSLAAMMLPTNDGFIAMNRVALPRTMGKRSCTLTGYDAGSEINDELCASIPGPHCGGEAFSDADGEGFVHVHSGIHGIGDLSAAAHDWRNPVARVVVRMMP